MDVGRHFRVRCNQRRPNGRANSANWSRWHTINRHSEGSARVSGRSHCRCGSRQSRFHRDEAAFEAISRRSVEVSFAARAFPPFRPKAAAAGSLPCSSGVGGRSSTCPVATSMTSLAAWDKSLGRLGAIRTTSPAASAKASNAWAGNKLRPRSYALR
jgi:hypothetical protein